MLPHVYNVFDLMYPLLSSSSQACLPPHALPIHLLIYFLYYSPPSLISAVPSLIAVGLLTGLCVNY